MPDDDPAIPDRAIPPTPAIPDATTFSADTARTFETTLGVSFYEGQFPPPEMLAKFDEVVPGSAKKLIDATLKEGEHRRAEETEMRKAFNDRARYGLRAGERIVFAFLAVSAVLILCGHEVAGTILGTVDLVALVTIFVIGHRSREEPE